MDSLVRLRRFLDLVGSLLTIVRWMWLNISASAQVVVVTVDKSLQVANELAGLAPVLEVFIPCISQQVVGITQSFADLLIGKVLNILRGEVLSQVLTRALGRREWNGVVALHALKISFFHNCTLVG